MRSVVNTGRLRFSVIVGPFNATGSSQRENLPHKLESMMAHLERGGAVGFCLDRDKLWASFVPSAPSRGDTTLTTQGNVFSAWSPSATLAEDDIICIESPNPEGLREYNRLDGPPASNRLTLKSAQHVIYNYGAAQPVMVRWRDFFPVCYLPEDQLGRNPITHDMRITYTLDLTLETSPAGYVAMYDDTGQADGLASETDPDAMGDPYSDGMDLDSLVATNGTDDGSVTGGTDGAGSYDAPDGWPSS